jgi:hypothetical protein
MFFKKAEMLKKILGSGSLIAYLRKKVWALTLTAGNQVSIL